MSTDALTHEAWQAQLREAVEPLDVSDLRKLVHALPRDVSPKAQAAAVQRAAINHFGHVANLLDLLARGKRSKAEVLMALEWLPALMAAAQTRHRSRR
jgi:hypothetical protein